MGRTGSRPRQREYRAIHHLRSQLAGGGPEEPEEPERHAVVCMKQVSICVWLGLAFM